jgi:hypothetical protein
MHIYCVVSVRKQRNRASRSHSKPSDAAYTLRLADRQTAVALGSGFLVLGNTQCRLRIRSIQLVKTAEYIENHFGNGYSVGKHCIIHELMPKRGSEACCRLEI